MIRFSAFILFGAVTLAACASEPTPPRSADAPLAGRHWKLVELNGQPVGQLTREAFLTFEASTRRVSGSTGCNSLGGSYSEEPGNRIRFSETFTTKMACAAGMDTEQAFLDALNQTDNYALNGSNLSLNRARMAPLARFEATE